MSTKYENAMLLVGLAALIVTAIVLYQTPKYEATAVVLVSEHHSDDRGSSGGPIQPLPNAETGLQTSTLTVAKAVPTTPVARAVVERLNLPKGSAGKVLKNVSVEHDPGTMFIHITYEDSQAKMAQLVANAIGQVVSQKSSEISIGANRITATLWQPATLPQTPVSPKPLRNGLLTLVGGLALVLAWALVRGRYATLEEYRRAA